jgi:threonine dehydrogenase-like Zn-dependent dehydrogenase
MWESVLMLLASDKVDLKRILNRVAPLGEWRAAFDAMHEGTIVKGVLKP